MLSSKAHKNKPESNASATKSNERKTGAPRGPLKHAVPSLTATAEGQDEISEPQRLGNAKAVRGFSAGHGRRI